MRQAWLDCDVAQGGHCQPGQMMAAVALVRKPLRHLHRIRETIAEGERRM